VDPAKVAPVVTVSSATVNGAIGTAFTYSIDATYALTYGAAGLPAGLTVNTTIGTITGTPTAAGSFNVTLSATNTFGATGNGSLTIVIPSPGTPVVAGSSGIWIGLKNSDDVGTKFDLLVEVLKNGAVVGTGQIDAVAGGSSGFNNAVLRTIGVAMGSTNFLSGDKLAVRLSVRIAVGVTGHRSGTARLWFGDAAANSRIDTMTNGSAKAFLSRQRIHAGGCTGCRTEGDRRRAGRPSCERQRVQGVRHLDVHVLERPGRKYSFLKGRGQRAEGRGQRAEGRG
jgi:hypothetical protein